MLLVSFCLVNDLWVQLSPGSEIQWWIRKGFLGEGGGGVLGEQPGTPNPALASSVLS
jgi:hypothetical protein